MMDLIHEIHDCRKCPISRSRRNVVVGEGSLTADYFFLGEAPGYNEDRTGVPFCGAAGSDLSAGLSCIGLKRVDVYIANILKCRPPGNRNPNDQEIANCLPYLERQLEIVSPKMLIVMGRVAAVSLGLLSPTTPLGPARGPASYKSIHAYITYHPAYITRNKRMFQPWVKDLENACGR